MYRDQFALKGHNPDRIRTSLERQFLSELYRSNFATRYPIAFEQKKKKYCSCDKSVLQSCGKHYPSSCDNKGVYTDPPSFHMSSRKAF